ncbi:CD63 antigen [Strongylocentrotus purpuratus]|uniref:Tetraspanin n=1 Tax=Strongylocentrotus purpuratus TaxID=7668 RepID=A0A7M7GQ49_STRPU|nr:CD63 antigen [Strongylocentrotus purpuratus]|eukprot:XP_003727293.1 PREDICTED: CD63 antigen [Strongylocentrotus purpuratus]
MARGMQWMKYCLFIFTFVFVIVGIGLITAGFLTLTVYQEYVDYYSGKAIPAILISVGFIIMSVSYVGCCGAFKENYSLLKTYVFIMVLLLILELAAGISGYVLRDDIDKTVGENMSELQIKYNSTTSAQQIFDSLQQDLKCCGVHNYTDWMGWIPDQPNLVPYSCCKTPDTPGCHIIGSVTLDIYTDPCHSAVKDILINQTVLIAGVAIGVAVLDILCIVRGCCLMKDIKELSRAIAEMC